MKERVLAYIRKHGLMRAGDRVGVAVSGGADSVVLLRLLLELRADLGIVLSAVHFHHQIRGEEADDDQHFVEALAREHGLALHVGSGNVPLAAQQRHQSLETAARILRHEYFRKLLSDKSVDRIASAHTLDDQAETVLMRLLRGAGTKGLAGIYPEKRMVRGGIVRPLLEVTRAEILEYLRSIGQGWREDSTNRDLRHLRNRVRHELLPQLKAVYNPRVAEVLATTADIAREEEDFWARCVAQLLPAARKEDALVLRQISAMHPALQRRLIRALAEENGIRLMSEEVERVLDLVPGGANRTVDLPAGWIARRTPTELRFEPRPTRGKISRGYEYRLLVPGEVTVTEIGTVIRASVAAAGAGARYNPAQVSGAGEALEVVVRNWRAGDRFRPAHAKSPKKVKTLLQTLHLDAAERALWPVVARGDTIVWVRGIASNGAPVRIEETAVEERRR